MPVYTLSGAYSNHHNGRSAVAYLNIIVPAASPYVQYDGDWTFSTAEAYFVSPGSNATFAVALSFSGSGVSIIGDTDLLVIFQLK
jgi:hypothetical protein